MVDVSPILGEAGIKVSQISSDDLVELQGIVRSEFLAAIQINYPEHFHKFVDISLSSYHIMSQCIDHSELWTRLNRTLSPSRVVQLKDLSFFRELKLRTGLVKIGDDLNLGFENVVWRITRPGHNDVAPAHVDKWWWDIGLGAETDEYSRVKVWISVHNISGDGGLQFVPDSHHKSWPFYISGAGKPLANFDVSDIEFQSVTPKSGGLVMFHDGMLHRGLESSLKTRVSIEFTLLVPKTTPA